MSNDERTPILVIKLGALGDFVLALGPFAAIRRHHAHARITLLTTAPYVELARASPYFDEIWVDTRPGPLAVGRWLALRRRLLKAGFVRVYDLQTSDRSGFYFRLFPPARRPEWSGIVRGCSHPDRNPRRREIHTVERQAEQLRQAGITHVPPPDLSWLDADVASFGLPARFALLVPGGAAHRPEKRWPAAHYAELARRLLGRGLVPVLVGAGAERDALAEIAASCAGALSLAGRTRLLHIAGLARRAALAVGNDTGPMHLAAAVGCPSLVLFSAASRPEKVAPRGPMVSVLRRERLAALPVDEVEAALGPWLERPERAPGPP